MWHWFTSDFHSDANSVVAFNIQSKGSTISSIDGSEAPISLEAIIRKLTLLLDYLRPVTVNSVLVIGRAVTEFHSR